MKKYKIVMVFLVVILLGLINIITAANVGVSPASVNLNNVLRGGYAEKYITVSVYSENDILVNLRSHGEIGDWFNFSENDFVIENNEPYQIKLMVNPPDDTPNGNYTGYVKVETSGFGSETEGNAVGIVKSSIDLLVNVEIVDIEIYDCSVSKFEAFSTEKNDDVIFRMDIENRGNIKIRPPVNVDIWDDDHVSVVKSEEYVPKEILPTTKSKVEFRVSSNDLELGQYWADVIITDCLAKDLLTFDVMEPGALSVNGLLLQIVTRSEANIGETIPIKAGFRNTGEKEVRAKFIGKVSKDGKIIQVLESEELLVPIKESDNFNFFFTPKKAGKHIISGRVFYNGKRTYEGSTQFNVLGKKSIIRSSGVFLIYAFLVFLIIILFFKVRKERKITLNKLRRIGE